MLTIAFRAGAWKSPGAGDDVSQSSEDVNELHRETTVCDPTKLKGLSEKPIVSHWKNNTRPPCGA